MLCVKCGKNSKDNLMYCEFCGYKLPDFNPGKPKIDNRPVKTEKKTEQNSQQIPFPYGNMNGPSINVETGKMPVPNKTNFAQFSVLYKKKCRVDGNGEMRVCLEVDGEIQSVPSDLMDCVYADLSIIKYTTTPSLYNSRHAVWNLNNLRCYELSDNGIYYVKGMGVFFLDNSGKVKAIGHCENIIDIKLCDNILYARIYKGIRLIESRERRDGLGYIHEMCFDVYKVDTEIKTFYI